MVGVAHGSTDEFGVPGRVLSLSDDFYGALGRVAALSAVVERRVADIVSLWGKSNLDVGLGVTKLLKAFKAIKASREVPDALVEAMAMAKVAMEQRNELLHSLWPSESYGWRQRAAGAIDTEITGVAVLDVIRNLVEAIDALGGFIYSPAD